MSRHNAIAYPCAGPPMVELPDPAELEGLELVLEDGVPVETYYHWTQMVLLVELTQLLMADRGQTDYFTAGNNFVYYSVEQARFIAANPPHKYRHLTGPDYYFVRDVPWNAKRQIWVTWNEGGRAPDVVVELLSPTTRRLDRTVKKQRYETLLHTTEYYLYEPLSDSFEAFHLGSDGRYHEPSRTRQGRVWSPSLEIWLGIWQGVHERVDAYWLRFFDANGMPVLNKHERAEDERQRAEDERQRAEDERQRAESERQRAEDERQRAESERQRAEDERQRAENEWQRAESERQRAEDERQRAEAAEAELARLRAALDKLQGSNGNEPT